MAPYRASGNAEKLRSVEAFFAEDAARRAHGYAREMASRAQSLLTVVEEAVERGVALQLSTFWDIAPPLRQLLDGIPDDLGAFGVQIPPRKLAENPSYHDHPLQYLYSLLQHAEKSTYQFIESHTNLLCLLHEVKEAAVKARGRVLATRAEAADGRAPGGDGGEGPGSASQQGELGRLTDDLKEKVRAVLDQWHSALGEDMKGVKERIGAWLLQKGGWDETLRSRPGSARCGRRTGEACTLRRREEKRSRTRSLPLSRYPQRRTYGPERRTLVAMSHVDGTGSQEGVRGGVASHVDSGRAATRTTVSS